MIFHKRSDKHEKEKWQEDLCVAFEEMSNSSPSPTPRRSSEMAISK